MSLKLKDAAVLKRKFLVFAGLFSLVIVSFSWFLVSPYVVLSVFIGLLAGILDNFVMFMGVEQGLSKGADRAFAEMKKNMFERILLAVVIFFTAIQAELNMLVLFIAFLSIHLVNLVFVVLNARGKTP